MLVLRILLKKAKKTTRKYQGKKVSLIIIVKKIIQSVPPKLNLLADRTNDSIDSYNIVYLPGTEDVPTEIKIFI